MRSFALLLVFALLNVSAAEPSKPNVLFIAVDDLRPELGCYGSDEVISPHIDALANSGVTFNRAYCQQAVCNPSRASMLTGLRPDSTRVWDLVTHFRDTVPKVVTLPQHFRQHGYAALAYGKLFHNPLPDKVSWDEPNHWPKSATPWSKASRQQLVKFRQKMKDDGKSQAAINRMRAPATDDEDVPDVQRPDGEIAEMALAAMDRLAGKEKPFFLAVGFIRPHLPFTPPKKYWDLYKREEIALAKNNRPPKNSPKLAMNTMYELRDYMDFAGTPTPWQGPLTEDQQRRLKHGYLASVSFVDAQIGRLTKKLKDLEIADNTVVVLWGDHGWKLGEMGSWCKQTNYEIDARVPLIIRAPGSKANGKSTNSLVETLDIYPTLCQLTGLPLPKHLEGQSLVPLLDDVDQQWADAAYHQFQRRVGSERLMGYAIRTDRYRYVEWKHRESLKIVAKELYDLQEDSDETISLANQPGQQALIKSLSQKLWSKLPAPVAMSQLPEAKVDTANTNKKVEPAKSRPKLTFRNYLDETVTVRWVPENGQPRITGEIETNGTLNNRTTIGHRFTIDGNESNFHREIVVDSPERTVVIRKNSGPNIVVLMADDWSAPHASILGDKTVKTPTFDRIAREGVLFNNAFVSTPSCTPSRMAIATGQSHWRLGEAGSLGGSLAKDVPVYPEMLETAGYRIGFARKGAAPSKHVYRQRDPFGPRYKSFDHFLEDRAKDEPFCFWLGSGDPHRPYRLGSGEKSGMDLAKIDVPPYLPDNETVRSDLADYYWAVQRYDREANGVIAKLEELGELENTIVVMSGDNGMPFPRAKATLYDSGVKVPLAIRWGKNVSQGIRVDDFVCLTDLAPTFLEAAGLKPTADMTGQSLMQQLMAKSSGVVADQRKFVVVGKEQHVYSYPSRAFRTADYLYIKNYGPKSWPTGLSKNKLQHVDFAKTPWPTVPGSFSFNVDPSPTKQWMLENLEKASHLYQASFGERPEEELYDLKTDPHQVSNIVAKPELAAQRKFFEVYLETNLRKQGDPREEKHLAQFEKVKQSGMTEVTAPPVSMNLDPFYKKHISAKGYPIISSEKVNDYALKEAAFLINMMLAERPDVRRAMIASGSRMIIMAHDEYTNDVPEHSHLKPREYWNARARGLGGSRTDPVCSCGEENLLAYPGDPYSSENILIHEFAHNIHLRGMVNVDPTFDDRLKAAYESAMDKELWHGKYASTNKNEYFAEGVQSWFNNNREPDHDHNHVNTREELKQYDPALALLCEEVFGKTVLKYTKPTTRLNGHMTGYDPSEAPKFQWPKELTAVKNEIRKKAASRGKEQEKPKKKTNNEQAAKPNILFIAMDDLNDWVGCMGGHPQAYTPNIDRLAADGMLFTNAYCPGAACNPSRTAIMTGIPPHRNGLYSNRQNMRQIMPEEEIIPKYFSEHGYRSTGSGKMLHYFIDAQSWDDYFPAKEKENPFPRTYYPKKRPVSIPKEPWQYVETDWAALDVTDEEYGGDYLVTKWVSEQLGKKHEKPFFLACGLYRPHEPWFVPKKYFERFPLDEIQMPLGLKEDDLDDLPAEGKRRGPNRYLAHIKKHGQWKAGIQGYLSSIYFADTMLGRVLDALEKSKYADNTIVVLWSDHGWHLGEKQHWQKFTGWRVCARVPLIVKVPQGLATLPEGTKAGSICNQPVNLVDLFSTLCDLTELPRKQGISSHSLVPLLKDPNAKWNHAALTHLDSPGNYAVSTERWRYIHYDKGGEELYDIETDPHEWTNLAEDPKFKQKLIEMRKLGPKNEAEKIDPIR